MIKVRFEDDELVADLSVTEQRRLADASKIIRQMARFDPSVADLAATVWEQSIRKTVRKNDGQPSVSDQSPADE